MTAGDIAAMVGGHLTGVPPLPFNELAATPIVRLGKIESAEAGEISFLSNPKYAKHVLTTRASALLVAAVAVPQIEALKRTMPLILVVVDDPYRAFLKLIDVFHPPVAPLAAGIHSTAVISPTAKLGANISIGAHVVVSDGCRIGDRTVVYHNTVLHDGVEIGDDCIVYSNVTVREQCRMGNSVIIHSGTVIGSDGFGFAPTESGAYEKIPQRGIVVLEDFVEIGANCTIDRATIGETRICKGAKLDNLIQVAHNVTIGENTAMAAQTGISGSTKIGAGSVMGGQVGIAGHLTIAERSSFGAKSGVGKSITEPGKVWFGAPVSEMRAAYKVEAAVRQLPDLLKEFQDLTARVQALQEQVNALTEKKA